MTLGSLVSSLGVSQLWAILIAFAVILSGAFTAGKYFEKLSEPPAAVQK